MIYRDRSANSTAKALQAPISPFFSYAVGPLVIAPDLAQQWRCYQSTCRQEYQGNKNKDDDDDDDDDVCISTL